MAKATRLCSEDDCYRPHMARGMCGMHYARWRRRPESLREPCKFDGCTRPWWSRGYCNTHYKAVLSRIVWAEERVDIPWQLPRGLPCVLDDCERIGERRGLCGYHYFRWRRYGDPRAETRQRSKGTGGFNSRGYWMITRHGHPNANHRGRVFEHVVVMSEMIGRPLMPGENVHHKNGIRTDNRPENLELWVSMQPTGQRATDLLAWARDIIARYEPIEAAIQ